MSDVPQLAFSKAKRQQLWVPLIEKALAKLTGCYANVESGRLAEALGLLTGAPCETLELRPGVNDDGESRPLDTDLLWSKVMSYQSAGFLMGASVSSRGPRGEDDRSARERAAAAEAMGLITDHAYSLLGAMACEGARLVKLRNPWGRGEWRGEYAPGSHLWTERLRREAAACHSGDGGEGGARSAEGGAGEFWMSWKDFLTYYATLEACKLRPDWEETRMPLPASLGELGVLGDMDVTALRLETVAPTWAELTLQQQGSRAQRSAGGGGGAMLGDLGLAVVWVPGANLERRDRWSLVGDSRRTVSTFTTCEVHLPHHGSPAQGGGGCYLAFPTFGFNRAVEGEAQRRGGGGGGGDGRPGPACCVFSAQPLIITPTQLPLVALATALHLRCKEHGKVTVVMGHAGFLGGGEVEVGRFYMLRSDGGCIVSVENTSPQHAIELTVDVQGHNLSCSRGRGRGGGLRTVDVVPPSRTQIVRIDTQVSHEGGYSYSISTQYRAVPAGGGGGWGGGGGGAVARSEPAVGAAGLHAPFANVS